MEDEFRLGIGLDHVSMGLIMAAEGEAPGRGIGGLGRPNSSGVFFHISCRPQAAIW